jgi:serine phosphatase RsbU (regulator of sigma subunit)
MAQQWLFAAPDQLVEALHSGAEGARSQLADLLRQPLERLLEELIARLQLRQSRDSLLVQALHLAETHLRTRPLQQYAGMSWQGFRAALLLQIARLASHPFGRREAGQPGCLALPESSSYHSETLYLPHEQVGRYWFGGDWFAGAEAADGSLWVLLADVTGHGYFAYLLACGLPGVWQLCWSRAGERMEPAEVLALMHGLLESCLPEGVFVECTLARLSADGMVVVAPAGGSRLLLRQRGNGCPHLHKLRGSWLGLRAPSPRDQRSWTLEDGDEILLGTDGAFDQLSFYEQAAIAKCFAAASSNGSLLHCLQEALQQALQQGPQHDDITAVVLQRRSRRPAGTTASSPSSREAEDVPM